MALSSVSYTGNGSTTQFAIPYQYLFPTDVTATVNGTPTAFTFVNPGLVAFSPAPASASHIIISRHTDITTLAVVFEDGSTVEASDINTAELQSLYLAQEAAEALANETARAEAAEAALMESILGLTLPSGGTLGAFFTTFLTALPTTLPGTAGVVWNDGGVISIS